MNTEVTVSDNSIKHSEKKKKMKLVRSKIPVTLFYTYYFASSLCAEISPVFFFLCLNREVMANIVACSPAPLLATPPWEGLEGGKEFFCCPCKIQASR